MGHSPIKCIVLALKKIREKKCFRNGKSFVEWENNVAYMWPPSSKPTKRHRASFPLIGKIVIWAEKKINYLKFAPSERVVFSLSCVKKFEPWNHVKSEIWAVICRHFLRSGENHCVEKKSQSLTCIHKVVFW